MKSREVCWTEYVAGGDKECIQNFGEEFTWKTKKEMGEYH
jgi:hypothetical protein